MNGGVICNSPAFHPQPQNLSSTISGFAVSPNLACVGSTLMFLVLFIKGMDLLLQKDIQQREDVSQ
jgi:hypothetical protein